jgi:hypothetical protein
MILVPQPQLTKQDANQIAIEYLKKQKNTDKINVSIVEEQKEGWAFKGTCPIDLEGHAWVERFEIVIDIKGKVKKTDYALL